MNIKQIENCEMIEMYCKTNKTNDSNEYVLSTKTLTNLKGQKIPEVDIDLKKEILTKYFDIKSEKDVNRITDLNHNLNIFSVSIKDEVDISELSNKLKSIAEKDNIDFIINIQNLQPDYYENIKAQFDKHNISYSSESKSIMTIYTKNINQIFKKNKKDSDNIDLSIECLEYTEKDEKDIIINININILKLTVTFNKVFYNDLYSYLLKLIKNILIEEDINIFSHKIVISGEFNNDDFSIIISYIFEEIQKKLLIDSLEYNKINYISNFKEKLKLDNSILNKVLKSIYKNITYGLFATEELNIIDCIIEDFNKEALDECYKKSNYDCDEIQKYIQIYKLECNVINKNNIKNFYLKNDKEILNNIHIYNNYNYYNTQNISIDYSNDSLSLVNYDKTIYIDKKIDFYEIKKTEEGDKDLRRIDKNTVTANTELNNSTIKLIKEIYKEDILIKEFEKDEKEDYLLLKLYLHYFEYYNYLNIDFYNNYKYIFNEKRSIITILILSPLEKKINFSDNFKTNLVELFKKLLENNNKDSFSLFLRIFNYLSKLTYYNIKEINLREVIEDELGIGSVEDYNIEDILTKMNERERNYEIKNYKKSYALTKLNIQNSNLIFTSELINIKTESNKIIELEKLFGKVNFYNHKYSKIMYSKIIKNPYLNLISIYKSEKGDFEKKIEKLKENLNISKPFLIHKELKKYIDQKTDILRNISIYERELLKIIVRLVFKEKYIEHSELEDFMKLYIYENYVHATNKDSFKNILKTKLISEISLNNNDIKKAHMEAYKEDLKNKIKHYESLYNKYEHKKKDNLIPRVKAIGEKIKKESIIGQSRVDAVKQIIDNTDKLNQDLSNLKDAIEKCKKTLSNNNEDYSKMIDTIEKKGEKFIQDINGLIKDLEKDIRNMELKLKIVKSDHDILEPPEPAITLSNHSSILNKINTL